MNTINEAKKGSTERGAENYLKQVETTITLKRMDGTKPSSGSITIENGQVKKESISLKIDKYIVDYKEDKLEAWMPYEGIICKAVTELSMKRFYVYENKAEVLETAGVLASEAGPYAYGVEYSCELGDGEEKEDTVSLIMNMNIDTKGKGIDNTGTSSYSSEWCKKEDYIAAGGTEEDWGENGNNNKGPITLNKALKEITKSWSKLNQSQISIPSAEQITKASGKTLDVVVSGLSTWLYKNLYGDRSPYAYWTSTPSTSYSGSAWRVGSNGDIIIGQFVSVPVCRDDDFGVRPVITLLKSQLG